MLISASRRTDIPSGYSDWFFRRIEEGYVLVRNPINFHRVSRVSLAPDAVDGIVFWTKNPVPMLDRLDELKDYMYCFQFTLTPYGRDTEPNIPPKKEMLSAFMRLSDKIGADRVIWRYDPILISAGYSFEYHEDSFGRIAQMLRGYTKKVIISFIDVKYRGARNYAKELIPSELASPVQSSLAANLAKMALNCGMSMDACAEELDLMRFGIGRAKCVDAALFEKLLGCSLNIGKDKSQRPMCGCSASIDIGSYNTCPNGCRYCYANYSLGALSANRAKHSPTSALIFGEIGSGDKITEREVRSCKKAHFGPDMI